MPEGGEAAGSSGKMAAGMQTGKGPGEGPVCETEGVHFLDESDDEEAAGLEEEGTCGGMGSGSAGVGEGAPRAPGQCEAEEEEECSEGECELEANEGDKSLSADFEEEGSGDDEAVLNCDSGGPGGAAKTLQPVEKGTPEHEALEEGALACKWREQIDDGRRSRLQRIILVPRVIKQNNDLGVPTVKADWDPAAAQLKQVVAPKTRTVRGKEVVIPGTPPRVALAIIQGVMDLLEGMELYSMGLPEANGNKIRWRLVARAQRWCGTVLDFAFQLKQGSILDWLPAGGEGPKVVRGMTVDALVPQDAPGGYFDDPGFRFECSRLAMIFVMTGVRESYRRLVLCLLDCASFINMSQFTIMLVTENPHDFDFGWFAR